MYNVKNIEIEINYDILNSIITNLIIELNNYNSNIYNFIKIYKALNYIPPYLKFNIKELLEYKKIYIFFLTFKNE